MPGSTVLGRFGLRRTRNGAPRNYAVCAYQTATISPVAPLPTHGCQGRLRGIWVAIIARAFGISCSENVTTEYESPTSSVGTHPSFVNLRISPATGFTDVFFNKKNVGTLPVSFSSPCGSFHQVCCSSNSPTMLPGVQLPNSRASASRSAEAKSSVIA